MSFLVRKPPTPVPQQFEIARPISVSVPYDIYACIIASLDFISLQSFSLVCRDFKFEADKYLWCIFTLNAPARPLENEFWARKYVEEGCEILLRDDRAQRLRELRIDMEASLGVDSDPEFVYTLGCIMKVLQRAKRLRALSIKSLHHRSRFALALSSAYQPQDQDSDSDSDSIGGTIPTLAPPFPFRLERFTTDLFCDEKLHGFWATQGPYIKHVELLAVDGRGGESPPSLPGTNALPALTSFHATNAFHTVLLTESPVTTVDLAGIWEGECGFVKQNVCRVKPATRDLLLSSAPFSLLPVEDTGTHRVGSSKYGARSGIIGRGGAWWSSSTRTRLSHQHPPVPSPLEQPLILGPGILDLRLTIFDVPVSAHVYTSLIAFLPHLRALRLTHGDIPSWSGARREALDVLAGLHDLEVYEWAGGSPAAQADTFATVSKRCRCLREITFRWGNGNWFERRFERESEEAGWGIVQA